MMILGLERSSCGRAVTAVLLVEVRSKELNVCLFFEDCNFPSFLSVLLMKSLGAGSVRFLFGFTSSNVSLMSHCHCCTAFVNNRAKLRIQP